MRSTPPEHQKHYVRPAKAGQPIDDDEALAMGYALFDKIASEQAKAARQEDDDTRG